MGDSRDSDLISSITPDVMASLRQSHFFEKLDDVLSPLGGAATQECGSDYKLSQSILHSAGYDSEAVRDVFAVLRSQGGCCDCEILYNVAETSRLKAKYWQKRVHDTTRPIDQ